jgi:hypothetical protein
VAGTTVRSWVIFSAVDLERSCTERARPEADDKRRFADEYADRCSG